MHFRLYVSYLFFCMPLFFFDLRTPSPLCHLGASTVDRSSTTHAFVKQLQCLGLSSSGISLQAIELSPPPRQLFFNSLSSPASTLLEMAVWTLVF